MATEHRQRLLLLVAAVVLGLLAADRVLLTPLANLWKSRSAKIGVLRASVDKGDALLRREASLVRRWGEMNEGSLTSDPSQAEDDVLSKVDEWSREAGVNVSSYTPQWRTDAEDHSLVEVRLVGTTSMGSLVDFLYSMDRKSLPLRLDMLSLNSKDKTGSELGFEMRFSGLMLKGGDQ